MIVCAFPYGRAHFYYILFAQKKLYKKAIYDEEAVITVPGKESFRECVVVCHNGIRMVDRYGEVVKTAEGDDGEAVDAEDTGEKGYNYRS